MSQDVESRDTAAARGATSSRCSCRHNLGLDDAGWLCEGETEREKNGHRLMFLEGGVARETSGEQMRLKHLPFGPFQGSNGIQGDCIFQFFVRHSEPAWSQWQRNASRSLDMPSLMRVFTASSGSLSRAAISALDKPS